MSVRWGPIIGRAGDIVDGYPYLITLRQLHYRLVMTAGLGYQNTESHYKRLSALTAEYRRAGSFPVLLDQTREIHRAQAWTSPQSALQALADQYRLDRSEGQDAFIVLGGEKATLLAQLDDWFSDLGLPIVLLRGYGSQTYIDDVTELVEADGRKAVLVYAGDFDPSGEDILRDFTERCQVFDEVRHIAVRPEQVDELGLVPNAGKASDSRAAGFVERHGQLVQVEVEAIPPDTLRDLYQDAIDDYWDESQCEAVVAREEEQRSRLADLADTFDER